MLDQNKHPDDDTYRSDVENIATENKVVLVDEDVDPKESEGSKASEKEEGARMPYWLVSMWADQRLGFAAALLIAALWGILAGYWMPRGPLTIGQVEASIWISFLLVGVPSGFVWNSYWTMLVSLVTFQFMLEVMRVRVDGPTVDTPSLQSLYQVMAFTSGRGVQALLTLYPIFIGIPFGILIARYFQRRQGLSGSSAALGDPSDAESSTQPRSRRCLRCGRISLALGTVFLLILVVVFGIKGKTDGIEGSNSVAEVTKIDVNGNQLGLMVRGRDVRNPVLLYLAGGPGGSEMGAMRKYLEELENSFTVVTWDQRGSGKSYNELDPLDTLTPEGHIDDTIEVTDYLRDRFQKEQIYLLGQSWGSLLGALVVQEAPERYAALIGTGQIVNCLATDLISYNDTLVWARENGKEDLVNELITNGPPPYPQDQVLSYETLLSKEHDVYPYDHSLNAEGEGGFSESFWVFEYSQIEKLHMLAAFLDSFYALYPQIQGYNLLEGQGNKFDVPVFFVQGAHEIRGRSEVFQEWYPTVIAPQKDLVVFNTSGHRPLFEQPGLFVSYMIDTVLKRTS